MVDNSVDIVVTSPPYWNQRAYAYWPIYQDYMQDVSKWVAGVARVLKPGRHCFWVIPDKLPWPPKENGTSERLYQPIYADTERCAANAGLVPKYPIIWKKLHGTQKMFGSYPYPPTVIHTPMTERICVWRKPGRYFKPDKATKEASQFSKKQWVEWAQDVWEIRGETGSKHPAPFPQELVRRILILWSFTGDLVFDPFMGSGTTALASMGLNRHFFGCDSNLDYVAMTEQRLSTVQLAMEL